MVAMLIMGIFLAISCILCLTGAIACSETLMIAGVAVLILGMIFELIIFIYLLLSELID